MASTRFVVMSRSKTVSRPSLSIASTARPARVRRSASRAGSTGTSTNSRSHESGTFMGAPSRELLQEAQVVRVEEADVVDAVAHHGHALDAQAEGEAGDLFRVVDDAPEARVDRLEHGGIDHPRA